MPWPSPCMSGWGGSATLCSAPIGWRSERSGVLRGRLILPGDGAERDRNAIPSVDRDHRHRQGDEFLLGEVLSHFLVERVRHMVFGDQRERFGPGQCGAFAIGEER